MGEEFSIHIRTSKAGVRTYYAQFRRPDGEWGTAKSTGIRDRGRKRDRQDAIAWAQRYLDSGQVVSRERMTFKAYAEDFFAWDGEWAKEKRLRGHRISERQADRHGYHAVQLAEHFGDKRIADIDEEDIRRWQRREADNGSAGGTINRKTVTLRLLLKAAYREKLLRRLPTIEAVAERPKSRGTYTPDEIRALFGAPWPDQRCYVANLTACATGMRASEVVALRERNLHAEYVEVEAVHDPMYGFGPTKNRRPRLVPIPARVHREMRVLLALNPWKGLERFLFYGTEAERPMDQVAFTRALYVELERIGVDARERERRRLDYHAWRHTLNTLLVNNRVPLPVVQAMVGHLSAAMTQTYYHLEAGDMKPIRKLQAEVLG